MQRRQWALVILFFALLTEYPVASVAQVVEEANISGQPLMYVKAGKVDGCGIRLISVLSDPSGRSAKSFDVSLNFWADGRAGLKGLAYDIDIATLKAGGRPANVALHSFWMKAEGKDAPQPYDGRVGDTEDPGGKIYGIEFAKALELYDGVLGRQPFTVGVRRITERTERIYVGRVNFDEKERAQSLSCLRELTQRLK
jgi:hypothetical protein